MRYRIGIVDPPQDELDLRGARLPLAVRHARTRALYYPWVRDRRPDREGRPGRRTGHPAAAAVRVRGRHLRPQRHRPRACTRRRPTRWCWASPGSCTNVTFDRQSVLNPEGINALRFFPGRGNRVWGARTMSSDPEWKYVNVRRLFIYLEHSIDKSTQWAVFEPNNERLWANIRQTIEDFLLVTWRTGALMGTKPEEAYFVRCDRTTMTQNDLDNGRLICLIGVAPTYPAEFVIFRIGQWTADAQQS